MEDLRAVGEVELFDAITTEDQACQRVRGQDIVLADMFECCLNERVLSGADSLKLLCINSTGYDLVDASAARRKNILVANVPGFSTEAVAEHSFALLLSLVRHIADEDRDAHKKPFQINPTDKEHRKYLGFNLFGKTIGIYGTGAIGRHVAKIAKGFGMKVIGTNRSMRSESDIEIVNFDELLKRSDILTLHAPLNADSKGIINAESLSKMKDGVIIINTARGGCVISSDLAAALNQGKVGGAGLDILDEWDLTNPLLGAPRTIITPHAAWFTSEALDKIGNIIVENVKSYIMGAPKNIVISARS